jgi:Etoposide-induced protein 2.4 (EI24)
MQGVYYFATHRFLWTFLRARLLPIILLSAFIYFNLFFWTYLPQVALLGIFHGPGAWVNAAVLVLGEGQVIIALLFEAFLVDETLVDIFDSVLIHEGLQDLVEQARTLHTDAEDPAKMLGKPTKSAVYSPFSLRQIVEFVAFLPINFIPFVGIPIFLIITGYRAGPFHHWRYFKLLGLSRKERKQYIQRRMMKYTWFGTVALMLQLVPVLSMFFLLTSAAGSALWVVKMEKARRERERVSAPEDPYQDDPF